MYFEPNQEKNVKITPWIELSDYDLDCFLCGALDSAYGESWQWIKGYRLADGKTREDFNVEIRYQAIFCGGAIEIQDEDEEWHRVDRNTFIRAVKKFYNDRKKRGIKFDLEQTDALDNDGMLQFAVFGKWIYG